MMRLSCNIAIKNPDTKQIVRFNYVNAVEVVTSIRNFTDTAKITVPRKLAYKGKSITEFIKRNFEVTIDLGYDDVNHEIFKGYVKSVSTGTPIVIDCENEAWKLKQIKLTAKHYSKLNIQDFVKEHMSAYECFVPSIELGEVRINSDVTLAQVFEYFMKNYPVNFYFREGKFYGILPTTMTATDTDIKTVKFRIGYNTINDDLTYTLKEDIKLQIVAKAITKDNKKLEWKEPKEADSADIRTFLVPGATSESDCKKFAIDMLAKFKVDKMTGDFTAFGEPYVRKGDVTHLLDDDHAEQNNKKFWNESIVYTYGMGGYRQKITLGGQL
ncbi:MAG: hypothetical protein ACYC6C_05595 [Coriobacteriia bacterium]